MADNNNFVQVQDKFLSGSGVTSTATTMTLRDLTYPDTTTTVVMADFGDTGYATLEPNTIREENIKFTGITQNASGTATLTGVTRGLKFKADYAQDTSLRQAHAGGTLIVFANSAPFYNELSGKDNDETITGTWTFTNPNYPKMDSATPAPTADEEFATKKYADDLAIAGAPDATPTVKGLTEIGTQTEVNTADDTGSTTATTVVIPSTLADVIQRSAYVYAACTDDFAAAFLTGDTGAESVAATWAAVSDASFRITIDGTAYNVDAIDFSGDATMEQVAATLQVALRAATSSTETLVWSTDHFVISSVDTEATTSAITVTETSTGTVGTDISGAGASDWMDADTANGVVTAAVMTNFILTSTPATTALTEGQLLMFKASNGVIGTTTINRDGLGATAFKKLRDQNLEDLDIETGSYCLVGYDGAEYQLLSVQATMPTTAILTEMAAFFAATDITGAEAETLTDGSDADALHTHTSAYLNVWVDQRIGLPPINTTEMPVATVTEADFCFSDDLTSLYMVIATATDSGLIQYKRDTLTGLYYWAKKVEDDTDFTASNSDASVGVTFYNGQVYVSYQSTGPVQNVDRFEADLTGLQAITMSGGTSTETCRMANDGATFYILDSADTSGGYYALSGTTLTRGGHVSTISGAMATRNDQMGGLGSSDSKLIFTWDLSSTMATWAGIDTIKAETVAQAGGAATELDIVNWAVKYPLAVIPMGQGDTATEYCIISMDAYSDITQTGAAIVWERLALTRISKTALGL